MNQAELILTVAAGWLGLGGLVGLPFLVFGVQRIDPSAKQSWLFRPLLLPGVAALWPLVLLWWIRGRSWAEDA